MIKEYYNLTKPGIIYGNAITSIGGFLLASKGHVDLGLFIPTILGASLIIASACVFNNYIDRGIDKVMARTKKRAMVMQSIPGPNALIYGAVLGIIGILLLALYVNSLTLVIGLIAFFDYVVLYGWSKRKLVQGTVIGSIAGAAPIVAGYCAVTDRLDSGALILFLILVFWQMPHFYAIAMYRFDDYAAAKIPVLPVKLGMRITKVQILVYIVGFILANIALTLSGYTKVIYLIVMTILGLAWLWLGIKGFKQKDDKKWARKMFFFSLIIILCLSVMVSVGGLLP